MNYDENADEITIYDINGNAHSAVLINGVPEIKSNGSSFFSFQIRERDNLDSIHWFLNGYLHREDGTAIESADGNKFWYLNGKLHRLDGPAIEYANGNKEWYIKGKKINKLYYHFKVAKFLINELSY